MKYLFLVLMSFSVFAESDLVEKIKAENIELKKKIKINEDYIKYRESVKSNYIVEAFKNTKKDRVTLGLGIQDQVYGAYNEIQGVATVLTLAKEIGNFEIAGHYAHLNSYDFPTNSSHTVIRTYQVEGKYNYSTTIERLSISPSVGIYGRDALSPDAGMTDSNTGYSEAAEELALLDDITSQKGLYVGLSLNLDITNNIVTNLRYDTAGSSPSLHFGYKL